MPSKSMHCALLWLFSLGIATAQNVKLNVNPTVQQSDFTNQTIQSPKAFCLKVDKQREQSFAVGSLRAWSRITPRANDTTMLITLGVRGDKSIRLFEKHIPDKWEGYYLKISPKSITIAGHDERGLYYGIQTLRQMMQGADLSLGSITDYPDVPYRGVVEGFYGTPWSYEARLRQLDFYGANKLNVYIYGPKDDPYHSTPKWREPYPDEEAKQIKSLVGRAKENGVIFYWAIHPGQDIKWNEEDREAVLRKFERMYELGVRGFAVFFDDISGEGTKAEKQVELLNYIDNQFIKIKGDVAPLVMCPTEYNKAWSNIERGYLPTLGAQLNQGVEVMWTGNSVVTCIQRRDMEWVNQHIKRRGYVWFNFPVSDFVRDHLLLGETYGNSLDLDEVVSGFLSNPMEHAEASKIALYSVADYTWNMRAYDARRSWESAMDAILPEASGELRSFAEHSSALGANGHRFEREESLSIQAELKRIQNGTGSVDDFNRLLKECQILHRATNILLALETNPPLLKEIKPWLLMAKLVAEYGQIVLGMNLGEATFQDVYREAIALQRQMYLIDTELNQNPYQPGVKYGSQHLLPAIKAEFVRRVSAYNKLNGQNLKLETAYKPFDLECTIPQLKDQPIQTRGKQVSLSPSNEVILWGDGHELVLRAKQPLEVQELLLDLGRDDVRSIFRVDILVGDKWEELSLEQVSGKNTFKNTQSIGGRSLTALRIRAHKQGAIECRLRQLRLTLK